MRLGVDPGKGLLGRFYTWCFHFVCSGKEALLGREVRVEKSKEEVRRGNSFKIIEGRGDKGKELSLGRADLTLLSPLTAHRALLLQ